MFQGLSRLAPRLSVENRLQLRWETFCPEAVPLIEAALAGPLTPAIAFNDHTSMALLHPDVALQDRPFDHDPAFPLTDIASPAFAARMEARAKRAQMPVADLADLGARHLPQGQMVMDWQTQAHWVRRV
ncbi:MAG: hypothetical protein IE927_13735 [Rhodobacterales bacterium]|nr:hypothetical protein [Rhodobacterales bacterium]